MRSFFGGSDNTSIWFVAFSLAGNHTKIIASSGSTRIKVNVPSIWPKPPGRLPTPKAPLPDRIRQGQNRRIVEIAKEAPLEE